MLAVSVGLAPASAVFALDVVAAGTPVDSYPRAGPAMLVALVPYAVVMGWPG